MDPGLGPRVQRPDGTLVPIAVRLVPHQYDGRLYVAAHLTERE
jgi:hypothetical protein